VVARTQSDSAANVRQDSPGCAAIELQSSSSQAVHAVDARTEQLHSAATCAEKAVRVNELDKEAGSLLLVMVVTAILVLMVFIAVSPQ
jgi:hypothetical protein